MKTINKQTMQWHGKNYFLLGITEDGEKYFLQEERWDCGWYWGCGYVNTFTNNKSPHLSRDISSHQHFDSLFFNKNKHGFDAFKEFFTLSTVTEKELWTLCELMKTIYTSKEWAEVAGRGGSHYTSNPASEIIKNPEEVKRINEIVLPRLFEEVKSLLVGIK